MCNLNQQYARHFVSMLDTFLKCYSILNSRNVLTPPPMLEDLEEALLGSANEVALTRGWSLGLLILASHSVLIGRCSGGVVSCYPVTTSRQLEVRSTAIALLRLVVHLRYLEVSYQLVWEDESSQSATNSICVVLLARYQYHLLCTRLAFI